MQSLPLKAQKDLNPATTALELLARDRTLTSLKKDATRLDTSLDTSGEKRRKKCSYEFSKMFQATSSANDDSIDFPIIEWSSDDDDKDDSATMRVTDDEICPLNPSRFFQDDTSSKRRKSLHDCNEQTRSLVRCRAIATDLSSLHSKKISVSPMPTSMCTLIRKTSTGDFLKNLLSQLHDDFDFSLSEGLFHSSSARLKYRESRNWV